MIISHSSKNVEDIYLSLKKNDFAIIKNAFITADENIKNMDFDVDESGTTCVLLIILGTHLICANVGDSRCILTYSENNDPELSELKVLPLSIDYKIAIPEERNRIIKAGGLVEQLKDSMGERTRERLSRFSYESKYWGCYCKKNGSYCRTGDY